MRKLVLTIAALLVAATLSAQAPAYYGVRLFMLTPSQVPTPVAGQYTLFIDTTNGNQVSAKLSNGSVYSIEGVGGGGTAWGALTGTLTDQLDLVAALALKENSGAFSGVGVCGGSTFASTLNDGAAPTCTQPDFTNLSGAATDAQIPNTITIDLATLATSATTATTATTANSGDSATAFFSAGLLEVAIGGTGSAPASDDQVLVSSSSSAAAWKSVPDCDTALTSKLLYDTTTNAWSCGTDQSSAGAPTTSTYITQTSDAGLSAEQALASLGTGIVKNTTGTGVLSIAVAGDFVTLNQNTTGTAAALTADGANCSAGFVAGGVSAAGVSQACLASPNNTAAVASNYLTSYTSATGAFTAAQPAFTDITGSVTDAQVPDTISITGKPVTLTSTGAPTDAVILTYTAIPSIAFTPAVSTNYLIDCFIRYTSSAATTGINFAWDVPTAATISMSGFTTTTAAGAVEGFSQRADNVGSSTGNAVITVENVAILHAQLLNGANATSTTLGFTPETANSVAVIAGSTCQYRVY